jgi:NADH-quinone oxidoreductase subunit I
MMPIVKGLALTLRRMFSKPVTRRYPKEKREAAFGYRGLHALVRDPQTGLAKCVGCGLCAAVCPSRCINIHTADGTDHTKVVNRYEIEVLRCVFCGFCMEACPFGAVMLTQHYEYSDYTREAIFMDKERLLANFDSFVGQEKAERYFKEIWGPHREDFTGSESQAVFQGAKSAAMIGHDKSASIDVFAGSRAKEKIQSQRVGG